MGKLASPLTLREAVSRQLRDAIIAGELEPGSLLKETELALRLGVSATPIREAFVDLAAEGLIEIETHRLKRVTPIRQTAMRDLLRVQAALWRMGYVWALPSISQRHFEELEGALGGYEAALAQGDTLAAIRASHQFHTHVIGASGNGELLRVTLDRRSLIARFILLRGGSTISANGLRQHRLILEALRKGDGEAALQRLDQVAARMLILADEAAEQRQAQD